MAAKPLAVCPSPKFHVAVCVSWVAGSTARPAKLNRSCGAMTLTVESVGLTLSIRAVGLTSAPTTVNELVPVIPPSSVASRVTMYVPSSATVKLKDAPGVVVGVPPSLLTLQR